jgi:PAS domain-containing protein
MDGIGEKRTLWQVLWDYDPNGLVVVNPDLLVTIVNPSFCQMFRMSEKEILGFPLGKVLDDTDDFREAWEKNEPRAAEGKEYPRQGLFVRRLLFPVREENIVAGIMVDLTHEWKHQKELDALKEQTINEISAVIGNQTRIAQEIARLLGETTAESQVGLHRLIRLLKKDLV